MAVAAWSLHSENFFQQHRDRPLRATKGPHGLAGREPHRTTCLHAQPCTPAFTGQRRRPRESSLLSQVNLASRSSPCSQDGDRSEAVVLLELGTCSQEAKDPSVPTECAGGGSRHPQVTGGGRSAALSHSPSCTPAFALGTPSLQGGQGPVPDQKQSRLGAPEARPHCPPHTSGQDGVRLLLEHAGPQLHHSHG